MPEVYDGPVKLTVLLPAYNEAAAIPPVVAEVRAALAAWPDAWEILVVDDASTDGTVAAARAAGVRVVERPVNGGSGASRKTGIHAAKGEWIAMLDADGTYVASHLPEMLSFLPAYDQVNGARVVEAGTMKALRVPAKWFIRKLAEWVSGHRIPDLNTGLKVFKRDVMKDYLWALPPGFSCVTSMTLSFLCNGHPVKYVPVGYRKRIGKSKFHPVKDTFRYGSTVLRLVMYFRPMRIFGPMALLLALLAAGKGAYDFWFHSHHTLQESDLFLGLTAVMVFVLGLIADLIVAQARARR